MNKLKLITDKLPEFFKKFYDNELEKSRLNKYKSSNIESLYNEVHQKSEPVFILSPGRSGTKYLTQLFSKYPNTKVVHVGSPEFTYYNNFAFQNQEDIKTLKNIVDSARYEPIRNAYVLEEKFIETNNRITFYAKALSELYPNSKFIELKRDPYEFVQSGYSRNWYSESNLRDEGRIRLEDNSKWESMDQVEKIAFQWKATHDFIDNFFSELPQDRFRKINAKDMFSNEQTRQKIIEFSLGENVELKTVNLGKVNAQSKIKTLTPKQLDQVKLIIES